MVVFALALIGCGGSSSTPAPVVLSVSLGNPTITVSQGGTILVPVTIVAPTETATFTISGLPAAVTENYKESESNPSGQLTITAGVSAPVGTTMPKITVGSSGQTASLVFTLVVTTPAKEGSSIDTVPLSPL